MSFFSSLFSRKKPAASPGTATSQEPLLVLLHAYVLDCIGELSADKQSAMRELVQAVYGGGPDWRATIHQELRFGPSMDGSIRGMWERNQVKARDMGVTLRGEEFADMIVRTNFAQYLG